jgi:hypothetical protein
VFVDLDAQARDAAMAVLTASDAPLREADDLVAAVTGTALRLIVAARVDLFLAGHQPDADAYLPIPWLPLEAQQHAALAQAKIGITGKDRDLPAAEALLARTAAFCMAAIDRLRSARGTS